MMLSTIENLDFDKILCDTQANNIVVIFHVIEFTKQKSIKNLYYKIELTLCIWALYVPVQC